jgi:hypothetical protein
MKTTLLTYLASGITWLGICSVSQAQLKPGDGIRLGKTTLLVPEISASYTWNDNVNLRRRAVDAGGEVLEENDADTFISGQLGLSLRHWNKSMQVNSKVWYNIQDYAKFNDLDEPTYGGNVGFFWARPGADTTIRTDFSLQTAVDRTERGEDFVGDSLITSELENVAERVKRTESRFDITVDQKLMTDVRGSLSYSYADFSYDAPRYNDRVSHSVSGEANYQWTDKTQPYFRLGIGIDEDEGFDGNAEKPYYLIGVRHQPTAKLNFDFGVGYETYTRTPSEGTEAGNELEDSSIKWTAAVNYNMTHKTRVSLNGRTGYSSVASPGSSSRKEISASFALDHQTTRQLSQRASVAWRDDDYLSPFPALGGLYDEHKKTIWYQYRIDYQTVRPWLSIYAQLSYEDGKSEIPGDSYTQSEITVGAKARY